MMGCGLRAVSLFLENRGKERKTSERESVSVVETCERRASMLVVEKKEAACSPTRRRQTLPVSSLSLEIQTRRPADPARSKQTQ